MQGAQRGAGQKIWLAEARDGSLVRIESGRSREALIDAFRVSGLDSLLLDELERVVSELARRARGAARNH